MFAKHSDDNNADDDKNDDDDDVANDNDNEKLQSCYTDYRFQIFYCFLLLTNIISKYNTLQEEKRGEQSPKW